MKKVAALVLSLVLTLGMFQVTAFAETQPTFTIQKTTTVYKPGDTFSLSVKLTDNEGGIAGCLAIVQFDDENLTCTGRTKKDLAKDDRLEDDSTLGYFETCTYTATTKKLTLQGADGENVYGDGTICTLNFKVNDDAKSGSYDISLKINECYSMILGEDTDYTPNVVKSTVTIEVPVESGITSMGVIAAQNLEFTTQAQVEEADGTPKAVFTKKDFITGQDVSETVTGTAVPDKEGVFSFNYDKVLAYDMATPVTVEIKSESDKLIDTQVFSIKEYAKDIVTNYKAADLELTEDQYLQLRVLLADMLNYGAAAQKYVTYSTAYDAKYNELYSKLTVEQRKVSANIDAIKVDAEEAANEAFINYDGTLANSDPWIYFYEKNYEGNIERSNVTITKQDANNNIKAALLRVGKDVALKFQVNAAQNLVDSDTPLKLVVECCGHKETFVVNDPNAAVSVTKKTVDDTIVSYVMEYTFAQFAATQFGNKVVATLYNTDADGELTTAIHQVEYCVNAYTGSKRASETSSDALKQICACIYDYGCAALEYVAK